MTDEMELLVRLHEDADRQGPGSDECTCIALKLTGLDTKKDIKVLDIGCGSGAQTIALAKNSSWQITAIDLFQSFLDKLNTRAMKAQVANRIITMACSMDELFFESESFDLIWSEGSIYNIGFENGLKGWKRLLKKYGYIAVSEITWTTDQRPKELESHWNSEYPGISKTSSKIEIIERLGLKYIGSFTIPESCWEENYYIPMEKRFEKYLKNNPSEEAKMIIENEKKDIYIYRKYKKYYSYVFYIMQKYEI